MPTMNPRIWSLFGMLRYFNQIDFAAYISPELYSQSAGRIKIHWIIYMNNFCVYVVYGYRPNRFHP